MATFLRSDLKPRVEFPMHEYREKNKRQDTTIKM